MLKAPVHHYLRIVGAEHPDQIWCIDDDEASLLGVTNPTAGPGSYFCRRDDETIWEALARQTPWMTGTGTEPFFPIKLSPREFYPRVARPLSISSGMLRSPSAEFEKGVVAMGQAQATTLLRRLEAICQTIHPTPETLSIYGHEIRNLLILAATEVETHWRGVLVANGVTKERLNTVDYVRLLEPMRLDAYEIEFSSLPWLPSIRPFAGWSAAEPTLSLEWYDAYNGVKHNREQEFHRANLANAFLAVSAVVIMLAAQFTRSAGLGGRSDLSAFFRFCTEPRWTPAEIYIDGCQADLGWSPVPLWGSAFAGAELVQPL